MSGNSVLKQNIRNFYSAYEVKNNNFLLTEREGRTREYWPEVVAVRTERIQKRPRANIPQYGLRARLEGG